jgi:hypothetical protein
VRVTLLQTAHPSSVAKSLCRLPPRHDTGHVTPPRVTPHAYGIPVMGG